MTSPKRHPMPAASSVDLGELPSQMMAIWQATMSLPMAMAVEGLRFAGQRMQAQAEYLKTSGSSLTKYKAGMAAVRAKYGAGSTTEGRWEYITRADGLNLPPATIDALRTKFGA